MANVALLVASSQRTVPAERESLGDTGTQERVVGSQRKAALTAAPAPRGRGEPPTARETRFQPGKRRRRWTRRLVEREPVTRAMRVSPFQTYLVGASCSRTSKNRLM